MNEQIEELEIALQESQHEYDKAWHECFQNKGKRPERENVFYAKYLMEKKGYRRQEDVATEIISEIEQAIMAHGTKYAMKRLAELKKKYGVTD